ncbi:MAG: PRD domain-containing protein [Defluviitaleaceae bacterium]|nr:PRD domain-containing protein [Defluviitaleaceae bacterium]
MLANEEKYYKILNQLIAKEGVSLKELALATFSSYATTKKNIRALNEKISEAAKIVNTAGVYNLDIHNIPNFEKIMSGKLKEDSDFNSSKKRLAFIIKEVLANDHIIINDLAESLMVSRATVNNDIKDLKVVLKRYNLHISGKTRHGLQIVGSESGKRLLILHQVYDYFSYLFPLKECVLQYIAELQDEFRLNQNSMRLLTKEVGITVQRVAAGFSIKEEIPHYKNYKEKEDVIQKFIDILNETYNFKLTTYDIDFVCFPISTRNTAYVSRQAMEVYEPSIYCIYEKIINEIHCKLIIDFDEHSFFQSVKYHLMFLMNRAIFYVESVDLLSDGIQRKYPLAFELAKVSIGVLEKELGINIRETETAYLAVYFQLELNKKRGKSHVKIGIISTTGMGILELIKSQLLETFGEDVEIAVFSESDYTLQDFSKYFAVFTAIPVKPLPIPIIKISDIFDNRILKKSNLLATFNESNIIIHFKELDHKQGYRENIIAVVNELTAQNVLDETFLELLLERERQGAAILSDEISIPHAINKNSNKIVFCAGTCNGDHTQIMFLLGIPEFFDNEINKALVNLYDMIFLINNNHRLFKQMLEINNKQEFISFMKATMFLL